MTYVLGIDAGGTFIDYYMVDESGTCISYKSLVNASEADYGIISGLELLGREMGQDVTNLLGQVRTIVHGTTVTTNAVLTHSGAPTALLTTEGLIDLLEMRQGVRDDPYDNMSAAPAPLVERWLRIPIIERLNHRGEVIKPLDLAHAGQQIEKLAGVGIRSVAVALAHSYVNPAHELELCRLLRQYVPEVHVSLSHQVLPQVHMYRRVSTVTLDAYVAPVLERYMHELFSRLQTHGFKGSLFFMQSNGGTVEMDEALRVPAMSLLSGPAAGPNLVRYLDANAQLNNVIVVDMGGTSFDISLVRDGHPGMSNDAVIAGHLMGLPVVDVHTIGAGGGSLAWVDSAGLLHVGPLSAGAYPGPVCYGQGGNQPTCTDADLVLGLIDPDYFWGGRLILDKEAAGDAIVRSVAQPLGVDLPTAAFGIFRMINTEMTAGIKEVTLEKGYDPRDMTMVVGGGAGPLHAADVARQIGITRLIIPQESPVMCALGMLCCGYRRDYYQYHFSKVSQLDLTCLDEIFEQLWERALKQAQDRRALKLALRQLDMRYQGQHYQLRVSLPVDFTPARNSISRLFHEFHQRVYGYDLMDLGTEIEMTGVSITVRGEGWQPPYAVRQPPNQEKVLKGSRQVCLDDTGIYREVPVYDGDNMPISYLLHGPALVEQQHSTIVVPARFTLSCEEKYFLMQEAAN